MEQIVESLLDEIKKLNENLQTKNKEELLSKKDILEQYPHLTPKGVDKIFHSKNAPINRMCRPYTITRSSLEAILNKGF